MSLSSDKLNGHPTEQDPNPANRGRVIRAVNGWPEQEKARAERAAAAKTPAEQQRRVELAARNRARAIERERQKKMLAIYEIPEPVPVPGEKGLFSRWLKEKGDKRVRFPDMTTFCTYILERYGDSEKDAAYQAYLAEAEPQQEAEEAQAEETLAAITAVETQQPRILATKDLPPQHITSPEIAESQIAGMEG